jgi:hypothetical protein
LSSKACRVVPRPEFSAHLHLAERFSRTLAELLGGRAKFFFPRNNSAAVPALRIAGALFLVINLLAREYIFRHWRQLFGRDLRVDGDIGAVRSLRVE